MNSWSIFRKWSAWMPDSDDATFARNVNSRVATGNVPYAATSESEFAGARCVFGTRFGTYASFAGDHSSVATSSTSDAMTSVHTWSMKGSVHSTAARVTSHATITFLRSQRSTSTPAIGARKKPGTMRADSTSEIAAAGELPPTRVAMAMM